MKVFADTFYWIALINPVDKHAQAALRFDDLLSDGNVYTTEEVSTEVLAFFAGDSWLRSRAVKTVREILSGAAAHIIPQSHQSIMSGFEFYAAPPDKEFSLTDCISIQTMSREQIDEALTNDHHFEQEGLRTLFRDS